MPLIKTPIEDLLVFEPTVFHDERGYFFESYSQKLWDQNGIDYNWLQDNEAKSTFGVVRGLHYQIGENAQAKLVRVTTGEVYDVAVDLRQNSPSYGQAFGIVLSESNKKQLLVPKGFAHGYAVLSESAIFCYKCDNYYNKSAEGGIHVNDPQLEIAWPIDVKQMILSEKDSELPYLGQHKPTKL